MDAEVFDNFNMVGVVDLLGCSNMGIACVNSEPPRPYVALPRGEEHVKAISSGIDKFIMREMGREGPPPSKFSLLR